MGAFFTNVQVHAAGRPAAEVREGVLEAVRGWVRGAGFEELAGDAPDEEADRVVLVAPAGAEPWVAVYDEATEDQDSRVLRELAEALSRVGGTAVGILDHDSDILELRLCRDGVQVDVYNSHPDYCVRAVPGTRPLTPAERGAVAGEPERWRDLLVPGGAPEQLRAVWDAREVFAEDRLWRVAALVGWDPRRCGIGYTYLRRGEEDLAGFARLAFRKAGAPRPAPAAEGPPRFVQGGGQPGLALRVGEPFGSLGATFQSVSGAGRGLSVAVWGPALARGLVHVHTATLIRRGSHGEIAERREVTLEARSSDEGPLRYAIAEDFALPAGWSGGPGLTLSLGGGGSMRRLMDAQMAAWLGVVLAGEALAPGEDELHVGIAPLEHDEGQMSWTFTVTVAGP